jgi:hypothetical protein
MSFCSFLILALDGVSGQLYPGEGTSPPPTHWIGAFGGLSAGLDTGARGKIICLCRGSNTSRAVCSQTLKLTVLPHLLFRRKGASRYIGLAMGVGCEGCDVIGRNLHLGFPFRFSYQNLLSTCGTPSLS